jgi:hypothetical protein
MKWWLGVLANRELPIWGSKAESDQQHFPERPLCGAGHCSPRQLLYMQKQEDFKLECLPPGFVPTL